MGDSGGLLKDLPPLGALGGEDRVDLPLADEGVALLPQAGVHEALVHVPQADGLAVQEILALPRPVIPAGHGHLAARLVLQPQGDLGRPQPLADLRPAEDHVLHLVPPQGPGRLLPQHPANGVGEIGLAAAVGADNGGDGMVKGEHGVVREGFEALQFQCTQTQSGFPLPCIGVFGHGFSAPWAEKSMIHFIIATPTVFCNG